MSGLDTDSLAAELLEVRARGGFLTPPSQREAGFDIDGGYRVAAELARQRRGCGLVPAGRKIGFTNKTIWPSLGLGTVIWAFMYDSTVGYARDNAANLSLANTASTLIEPEIVFKLGEPLEAGLVDPVAILKKVEWLALGFEIVDCNYPGWKFKPADAIADFGLHYRLVIGEPRPVGDPVQTAGLLRSFQIGLYQGQALKAQGQGENVLDSPALALAWLAQTLAEQQAEPLAAGEIITTGTLTAALPVAPGEEWSARLNGLDLPELFIRFES